VDPTNFERVPTITKIKIDIKELWVLRISHYLLEIKIKR
jgi:hypothetical protein